MRFLSANLGATLVELDDLRQTLALLASLQDDPIAGVRDIVPAARTLLGYARRAWADIADPNSNKIFFDHDDYLKIWALSDPRLNFDTIFFDEAQDINPVLKKVIQDQDAQIIVVGDSNQAIYEFRGAVDALRDWPADVVLPLTQS